jgi:putative oxidoreductase
MDVDLGLLVVRSAIGPMLVLHGYNKLFGGGGIAGTTGWFASLGLQPARVHAWLAALTEIGAGVLMTLGLGTALAALAFVGLMLVATLTDHRGKGYFVFKGGWEYTLLVAMVAIGIAAAGPGRWSLDGLWGLDVAGRGWALFAALGGLAAAAGLLAACYRAPAPEGGRVG